MSGNIKLFWFLMGLYDYFMNGQAIQDIDFNNSRLLVGTEGGIALIDRSNNEVLEVFSKLDGLPTYDVTAVALQNSNQWYAATNPNGLSYYDNGNLTSINDPNSILSNFPVTDLYLSNSGVLWIATQGGGILNTQDRVNFNYFNTNNSNLGSNQASSFVSHNNQFF